jgi:Bax protein
MRSLILLIASILYAAFPSWYYEIKNVKKRKKAFVEIMLPLINAENKKILKTRAIIKSIFNDPYFLLNKNEIIFLAKIAKEYRVKDILDKKELLKRIDIIPPSLALAQAAVESGWGLSRFVKEGNNIFGHWSFNNKGILPISRYEEIEYNYSLKIFPSLQASVAEYMKNLNRNRAYEEFREIRFKAREKNLTYNGIVAARGLKNYSQLKEEYVRRIQHMIKSNGWLKYDNKD